MLQRASGRPAAGLCFGARAVVVFGVMDQTRFASVTARMAFERSRPLAMVGMREVVARQLHTRLQLTMHRLSLRQLMDQSRNRARIDRGTIVLLAIRHRPSDRVAHDHTDVALRLGAGLCTAIGMTGWYFGRWIDDMMELDELVVCTDERRSSSGSPHTEHLQSK